jgi:hypothetical protein
VERVFGAVALVAALFGAVLGADWVRDQYTKTTPEFAPREEVFSSSPPAFVIANVSPYFSMWNVRLVCDIESAFFDVGNGKTVGFSIPVTSGASNPPIDPLKTADYKCDPTVYMKIKDGKLSLLGLVGDLPEGTTTLTLANASVKIGVKYTTTWWPWDRDVISAEWDYALSINTWREKHPIYK